MRLPRSKQKLKLKSKTSVTSKQPKKKSQLMIIRPLLKNRLTNLTTIRRAQKSTRPNLKSKSHQELPKKLKRESQSLNRRWKLKKLHRKLSLLRLPLWRNKLLTFKNKSKRLKISLLKRSNKRKKTALMLVKRMILMLQRQNLS